MYRMLKMNMYPEISNCLNISLPSHRYPTSSRQTLILPMPRTQALRFSYKYQFLNVWNNVPISVQNSENIDNFILNYRCCLISSYL